MHVGDFIDIYIYVCIYVYVYVCVIVKIYSKWFGSLSEPQRRVLADSETPDPDTNQLLAETNGRNQM
jgi:hypothetical protein